jgi:hypothetical protein
MENNMSLRDLLESDSDYQKTKARFHRKTIGQARPCGTCGQQIIIQNRKHRYCSQSCYMKAYQRKIREERLTA